jgi:predicted Rossmann fold nucleotide-binding protein DprA/Smf involved in DNA uptake
VGTPTDPDFLGDPRLWSLPKTAFFCSVKYSATSVLRSYDWAADARKRGVCVISGFRSGLEKDVFELLLQGTQPVIWVLDRALNLSRPPRRLMPHVEAGRLLVASPFAANVGKPNSALAAQRNQFVAEHADMVVFAHIHAGGKLERLAAGLRDGVGVRVLDRE